MWLTHTLWMVGKAGQGKSQLLHALARELTNRMMATDPQLCRYAFSKGIDPFGMLTKNGVMAVIAVFILTDFEMVSRCGQSLSFENAKNLFGVDELGEVPARYHVAHFPEFRPMLCAVNHSYDEHGKPDYGSWFMKQSTPLSVLANLANNKPLEIAKASEDEKAIARRCIIFCCDEDLFDKSTDNQYARKMAILNKANSAAFTL